MKKNKVGAHSGLDGTKHKTARQHSGSSLNDYYTSGDDTSDEGLGWDRQRKERYCAPPVPPVPYKYVITQVDAPSLPELAKHLDASATELRALHRAGWVLDSRVINGFKLRKPTS
jgi:hypothetical protein